MATIINMALLITKAMVALYPLESNLQVVENMVGQAGSSIPPIGERVYPSG